MRKNMNNQPSIINNEVPARTISDTNVLSQVETAKRYPRDVRKCLQEAEEMALLSPEIAEACIYSVPRAGKAIQGPSVRLAEIFVSSWGNVYMAAKIKENNGQTVTFTSNGACPGTATAVFNVNPKPNVIIVPN